MIYALGEFSHENPDEWLAHLAFMPVVPGENPWADPPGVPPRDEGQSGRKPLQILRERFCVCFSCCPDMCDPDCPWCSRKLQPCSCMACPAEPCDPNCLHLNCNPGQVAETSQAMMYAFWQLWKDRKVFEQRLEHVLIDASQAQANFTLVELDGTRRTVTGQELDAIRRTAGMREAADSAHPWSINREWTGSDGNQEVELNVIIKFHEPEGWLVERSFWEEALDYFIKYDELGGFFHDRDYWHCHTDENVVTGTAFQFDLDGLDPQADNPEIHGEAIRYRARETDRGDIITYTEEADVVSRIRCRMSFADPESARAALVNVLDENSHPGKPHAD